MLTMRNTALIIYLILSPLLNLSAQPTLIWASCYGGSSWDMLNSTLPTPDGGYLLCGYTSSNDGDIQSGNHGGMMDCWVVKINSSGTIEWEKTYGGSSEEMIESIIPTPDGGYLFGGSTASNDGDIQSGNHGERDCWVVKINSSGTIEWEKTYGGSYNDGISSTIPTNDGGYLLCGSTTSNDGDIQSGNQGGNDYWVVKINSSGTIEWEQTYGGSNNEYIVSTIPTPDGGYLLGGLTKSNDGDVQSGNHGGIDYWVVKINSIGTIEWEQTYGGVEHDVQYSTIPTNDGGYLLGGYTKSDDGDIQSGNSGWDDYWLVKINNTGTIEWEQTYGGSSQEWLFSIIPTPDGGYLLSGFTQSNDGDVQSGNHGEADYWVVKIDGTDDVNEFYNENIKTYPNPVNDKLFVNLENVQSNVNRILLFNSNGKLVFSSEGTELKSKIIEIPTLNYNTGLYNLNLYTKQGVIQRKIVIVR